MTTPPLIIIVDTDRDYLEMMAECLNDEGYESLVITESGTAYHIIKQRLPQLVILELLFNDPERSLMVLNKMRLDPQTASIPVIIASTATELIDRNRDHLWSKRCDILLKPFDLEELLTIVSKYVEAPHT